MSFLNHLLPALLAPPPSPNPLTKTFSTFGNNMTEDVFYVYVVRVQRNKRIQAEIYKHIRADIQTHISRYTNRYTNRYKQIYKHKKGDPAVDIYKENGLHDMETSVTNIQSCTDRSVKTHTRARALT